MNRVATLAPLALVIAACDYDPIHVPIDGTDGSATSTGPSLDDDGADTTGTELPYPVGFHCGSLLDLLGLDPGYTCAYFQPYKAAGVPLVDGLAVNLGGTEQAIEYSVGLWQPEEPGPAWLVTDSWAGGAQALTLSIPADQIDEAEAAVLAQPVGTEIVGVWATLVTEEPCLGIAGPDGTAAASLVTPYGTVHAGSITSDQGVSWTMPRCTVGVDVVDRSIPPSTLDAGGGLATTIDNANPLDIGPFGIIVVVVDQP